ncbi:MAG: hypothetical protein ABF535_09355 [Acetobacter sp.]
MALQHSIAPTPGDEEDGQDASAPTFFSAAKVRPKILCWLLALLPMFGETFHYMSAIRPLWVLSKAFPILSLPLAFRLISYTHFPMTRQVLLSFAWLVLSPSIAAIFYFHEGFFTGVTAQVKLLPMLYFFSFLALLLLLKPSMTEIRRGFVILGTVTVAVLIVLWAIIPSSWYTGTYVIGSAPLFSADNRGHRIRMQMYFPIILLFFCYRRGFFEKNLSYLAGAAITFAVTLLIVRTRAMIIGTTVVVLLNTIMWSRPMVRLGLLLSAPFAFVAMFSTGYLATTFSTARNTGFDVRYITAEKASAFLGDYPIRWIFGVGTLSPTSKDSLISYFHHFFFLADITWLGIIFEYGLIGAMIFVLFELRGILFYVRLRDRVEDDLLGGMFDYLIYVLVISFFYPPTLAPGETATILAVFAYVWHAGGFDTRPGFATQENHGRLDGS